ncbi:MAG: hypothetical protein AAF465_04000 [Pseudomonadota bacterium]
MRIKLVAVSALSGLFLAACGSDDACNKPLPYLASTERGELVVPSDLNAPPDDSQKRIPPIAEERRARSNPCSVGPPDIVIEPPSGQVADAPPARTPPTTAAPVEVGPLFRSESVEETVDAWIASWRAGDAPSYLSYYATDFQSADQTLSRDEWMHRRQQLVRDTGTAQISIRDVRVEDLPAGRKMVRLIQDFVSTDGERASVVKLLEMTREFDSWRIRRERVVEVLPAN